MKKYILPLLSVFLGAVFLFSAYSKLVTVEFFELAVVDSGIIGWAAAPFVARLIIGLEFFIGLLLMLNIRMRSFTLPLTAILLAGFTLYLGYRWMFVGQHENCRCFGELLPLDPETSILKNAGLLLVTGILYRFHPGIEWKRAVLVIVAIGALAFILPFPDLAFRPQGPPAGAEMTGKKIDLDRLYHNAKAIPPSVDLRSGKHIVAFLSLKCPFCTLTGYKLRLMKDRNPSLPVWFIVNGKTRDIPKFLEETGAYRVPQTLLIGEDFKALTGGRVPLILLVENSLVVRAMDPMGLRQADVETWLEY